jgi:hypothetical protein
MKTYIGIKNGLNGACAVLHPDGAWQFAPIVAADGNRDRLLDIGANSELLRAVCQNAGGPDQVLAVCESFPIKPRLGAKGNFANGRLAEFWRIVLTLAQVSFLVVEPRTWQRQVFQGIPGIKPKRLARLFIEQRFPQIDLGLFANDEARECIRDAMCLALWARTNPQRPPAAAEAALPILSHE